MPDTAFASLLERAENVTETTPLDVPGDWMQGRAGYGGLVGALALKAMRARVPAERKVRSLLIAFVGPVGPASFSIHTQTLRMGRSVTTVEAKVIQAGAVCCTAVGSFGGDRTSVIQIVPSERPQMPGPDKALELPYLEGLTPAFTRHFDYRWALGDLPFYGLPDRRVAGGPGRRLAHPGACHADGAGCGQHVNLGIGVRPSESRHLLGERLVGLPISG